jgi:glycosyltransferase involved in cell wall biosynthesis
VLKTLQELFPTAPIYTLFYDEPFVQRFFSHTDIRSSFLQRLKKIIPYKKLVFLAPSAIESFSFKEFDLVISSSIAFAKGLLLKPTTRHICYCFSPTRWLWDWKNEYTPPDTTIDIIRHLLRLWDTAASHRIDTCIAISKTAQQRIWKYYRIPAKVIYPPRPLQPLADRAHESGDGRVQTIHDHLAIARDYFLTVAQLHPHKNVALAASAFAKLGLPLVIVGDGPEYRTIASKFGRYKNIHLVGNVPDSTLSRWYAFSRAFVMPQEEDFGIAAVEAMSYGKPVLALRRGGARETVLEGVTGEFFDAPHPAILADGVRRINENIERHTYSPRVIQKWAEKFSKERFINEFKETIYRHLAV